MSVINKQEVEKKRLKNQVIETVRDMAKHQYCAEKKQQGSVKKQVRSQHAKVRLKLMSLCVAMACSQAAFAQEYDLQLRMTPELGGSKNRYQSPVGLLHFESAPALVKTGIYASNSQVAKIEMRVFGVGAHADGLSRLKVVVTAFDKQGELLRDDVIFTVEHTGGQLDLNQSVSSNLASSVLDQDKKTPGNQVRLENGVAQFVLIAPSNPQDVKLRVTSGEVVAQGLVPFDAELRDMIAAGVIEGILRINKKRYDSYVTPARLDDGFEHQLQAWSRRFNDGKVDAAARAAMFLKGKIQGSALLSLSYDSDKPSRQQLAESIRPDAFYPVFGDSSVTGFDAVSSGKLYVRVDDGRDFVLYGDFGTGSGFVDTLSSGMVAGNSLSQLGNYNRSMTGLRVHHEGQQGFVNVYASRDSLRQVVQELRANGTSGPFAVNGNNAIENTDKIELLQRDKNDLRRVIMSAPLQRWVDYTFEPFSGRIILARPLASLDEQGNPQSLRVSYEMDQGGEAFWIGGLDGQLKITDSIAVGGSYIEDKNPNSPYQLQSINSSARLGEKTLVIAELAQSQGQAMLSNLGASQIDNKLASQQAGNAGRVEVFHDADQVKVRAWASQVDAEFNNPSAGITPNTKQLGINAAAKLSADLRLNLDARETKEIDSDAKRNGLSLSLSYRLSEQLEVSGGLRHMEEQGRLSGMFASIGGNPAPGSAFQPGANGGFANQGNGLQSLNGIGLGVPPAGTVVPELRSDTAFISAKFTPAEQWTLHALAESAVNSQSQHRLQAGARYQASERTGIYLNAESQTGLASYYSLDPNRQSNTVSLGIDSTYMRGGNFFSEYRLRDATSGQEQQLASGVRNAWTIKEGMIVTTAAERLAMVSGNPQKASAVSASLDYTAADDWKASARTEWRRLDTQIAGDPLRSVQDSFFMNIGGARKLSRDWTALARNYTLATDNHGHRPNGFQNRFQLGAAYRPVDTSTFDLLSMIEHKTERQINAADESREVLVGSVQGNFHPSRPWWFNGKLAFKSVNETFPKSEGGASDRYQATLLSGRAIYDVTENIDIGVLFSRMHSNKKASVQYATGLELGYLLRQNLWLSAGYNFSGFQDRDLTNDYTAKGVYFRLRFKFDQSLFNPRRFDNTISPQTDR